MIENDKEKFVEFLTGISQTFKENLTQLQFEMWWNLLKKYTVADFQKAMFSHMQSPDEGRFMPKPADIIGRLEGSEKSRALQAWSKVWQAVSHPGGDDSVVFDDPIIHAVIDDMGGWVALCMTETKEATWKAKEFEERYAGYLAKGVENYMPVLHGRRRECVNCELVEKIHYIGDVAKAKALYHQAKGIAHETA